GMMGLLSSVCIEKVREFENEFLNKLEENHKTVLDKIKQGDLSDDVKSVLEQVAKDITLKLE
ncbi:MAG: F0F1 ATP synthase subunit alpha, partial [Bacteroidales bacterium]|nr:F0F1 ATP synthase subunit alpha [Bacteroidales bacterium]